MYTHLSHPSLGSLSLGVDSVAGHSDPGCTVGGARSPVHTVAAAADDVVVVYIVVVVVVGVVFVVLVVVAVVVVVFVAVAFVAVAVVVVLAVVVVVLVCTTAGALHLIQHRPLSEISAVCNTASSRKQSLGLPRQSEAIRLRVPQLP